MSKLITSVLGNQKYELVELFGRRLLVIYGKAANTTFAIVPGWYVGNEKYEGNQLTAVDVELVDPIEQSSIEKTLRTSFENAGRGDTRLSFWGASGFKESYEEDESPANQSSSEFEAMKAGTMRSKILVVDDDPGIRNIIKVFLEKEGCNVETAGDTNEAKRLLESSSKLPNLMLLDIMMPGSSGWQLLRDLENDPKVSNLPVIAISGLEKPKDKSQQDSKMLYDYLVKPFSMQELSRVVRKFGQS